MGFLFLILYPGLLLLPPPPSHTQQHTHTQTTHSHTQTHTTTHTQHTHTNNTLTHTQTTHSHTQTTHSHTHKHTQHTHTHTHTLTHTNNTLTHTNNTLTHTQTTHSHTQTHTFCVAGVAQTHIYRHFTWPAWHNLTSTVVLRDRRGTYGTGWRAWTWLGARDAAAFCVAGVAQTHIYRHFTWQAWHNLTSTVVLRGRRGTNSHLPSFHVAGVAQPHIYRRFAWQAWHLWHWVARLDLVRRPWRRGILRGRRGTNSHLPSFHVAGVAQPHIYRRFAWQAWHLWHWVARLDLVRRPWRRGILRGRRGTNSHLPSSHVAGVAQPHIYRRFAWQAWHLWHWVARLDLVRRPWRRGILRGRRGTHLPSSHVAGVAQPHIYRRFAWQAWHLWHWVARLDLVRRPWRRGIVRGRRGTTSHLPSFHVAGVAPPHIYRRFAWQAWHLWHWVARLDLVRRPWRRGIVRGRRGTTSHLPSFHVAGVAPPHIYRRFAWQAWHLWHWVARLDLVRRPWRRGILRGRRGTTSHLPSFHVAGVAQPHIYRRFAWQAWHLWHWVARLDLVRRPWRRGILRGRRGTTSHLPSFHVAGVAQPHIYRRFAWQAWHLWHWVARLDLVRRPWRRGIVRGRRGTTSHLPSFHVAGVAQPHIYRRFAWQAWHLWHWVARLDLVRRPWRRGILRGRSGTTSHLPSFHVAGVAQPYIYRRFAWQAWHLWHWVARLDLVRRPWRRGILRGRRGTTSHLPSFCVAGVALMALGGALGLGFGVRGRRGTKSHLPSFWVLRGRCGTDGSRNTHLPYFCVVPTCFLSCLRMSCSGMSYGRSGMFYFLTRCLLRFVCSAGLFTHVLLRHSFWSLQHVVVTYCHVFALSITASFRVFRHVWFPGMFNPLLLSACFISIRICCQVLVFVLVVPTGGRAQCGKKRMQMPGEPTLMWIFATPVCFWTVWFLDVFGKTCTVSVITMVFACDCDCVVSSIVALTTSYIRVLYFCGQVPFLYVIIVGCIHTYMHACMHAYIHTILHTYIHSYIHSFIHTYHFTFSIFHHLLCLSFLPCPR